MRKLLSVCILIFVAQVLAAQQNKNLHSTTRVYTEDGKLQMLIAYDPKCACRTYTEYYHDGKVYAHRTFKVTDRGEYIDGEDVTYYPDGSIKIYKTWKNSLPDGKAYSKHDNGQLEHEEYYNVKFKTGTWKYYNKKGELVRELVYEPGKTLWNSKKENYTAKYYSTGALVYAEVYKDGKKISSTEKGSLKAVSKETELLDGPKLFAMKCSACHSSDKDGYGPALKGVAAKRSKDWLFLMIRNGMKLVDEGDKTAVALYNKWGKKKHPNMEKLSNKQVQLLIDYLKGLK